MLRSAFLISMVCVLSISAMAQAGSEIPDLKGTWVWTDQAIRHFKDNDKQPKMHTKDKSSHAEIEFTLNITEQNGFRFSGEKVSKKWTEPISGVIGFDNKTVYMVDDNGFIFCRIVSPDKMEQIYLHIADTHSVAARGVMIRRR